MHKRQVTILGFFKLLILMHIDVGGGKRCGSHQQSLGVCVPEEDRHPRQLVATSQQGASAQRGRHVGVARARF